MKLAARWQSDVFFRFTIVQVSVTTGGILTLILFMVAAVTSLQSCAGQAIWRAAVVGVIGGSITQISMYPWLMALARLSRALNRDETVPEPTWERLRQATYVLPMRLLITTLTNWPALSILLGLWMWRDGLLNSEDAFRVGMSGVLYAPVQGMILFYLGRRSLLRLAVILQEFGRGSFGARQGGLSIKSKLIASFVALAVVPLLAGVFINEIQKEQATVAGRLATVCSALDLIQAAGGPAPTPESWVQAVQAPAAKITLPRETSFQVTDAKAGMVAGSLAADRQARMVWRREVVTGGRSEACVRKLIPGERRYLVIRFFPHPGVWLSALTSPFPESVPFWRRYGATLILAGVVIVLGIGLGYLAADDVGAPIQELSGAAVKAGRRELVQVSNFLPDDEMSELAMGFNSLVSSVHRELLRSAELIARVSEVISGLGGQTVMIKGLADRQREVVNRESSLSVEASGGAEEVTRAATEIQDRARHTRNQMEEATAACREADGLLASVEKVIAGIVESSERIGREMAALELNYHLMEDVVKIIDEVADRTEMLALNAAIEAGARADKGSRFAVVAGEVQRLSERITEQTADIKRLFGEVRRSSLEMAQVIAVGRARAGEGPEGVQKLGQSLTGIEQRAQTAADSMAEIVKMTEEQTRALEQMRAMVSEIQSVAEIMDGVSSETESAAAGLNRLTDQLRNLVAAGKRAAENGTE